MILAGEPFAVRGVHGEESTQRRKERGAMLPSRRAGKRLENAYYGV